MRRPNRNVSLAFPAAALGLVAVVCGIVGTVGSWTPMVVVQSRDGVWDLRGLDLAATTATLEGAVAYVPGEFLDPEAFEAAAAREETRLGGLYQSDASFGTTRMRLLVPDGAALMVAGSPAEGAERLSLTVGGGRVIGRDQVGNPASSADLATPSDGYLTFTAVAEGGRLDIVEQMSNWNLEQGDGITVFTVGEPGVMRRFVTGALGGPMLMMGCFLALAVFHLVLWARWRPYRLSLWAAGLAVAWLVSAGVSVPKPLLTLVPALSWGWAFRLQYLSFVAAGLCLFALWAGVFPWVGGKRLRAVAFALAGGAAVAFTLLDSLAVQAVGRWFEAATVAGFAYLVVRTVVLRARGRGRVNRPQVLVAVGLGAFMALMAHQMAYYRGLWFLHGPEPFVNVGPLALTLAVTVAVFDGMLRDMAEARREAAAAEAERAALERLMVLRADMVRELSHEMHTPLSVMVGFAQLIAADAREQGLAAQSVADLEVVAAEAKRLSALVDGITALPVASREIPRVMEVDLGEVVRNVARLYQAVLERRGTALEVAREDRLPLVTGDADGLSQVLFNLLQNAHKHTEGGRVRVSVRRYDGGGGAGAGAADGVVVSVADTGTGMPVEAVDRVFERYETAGTEPAGGPGAGAGRTGSGIGLYVARRIVESHGGRIWLETAPGLGTEVTFTIPAAAPDPFRS